MKRRENEGYRTKQKTAVLSLLETHPSTHYSAEEIWMTLRQQGLSIGKATVYRALDQFVEKGLVRRFVSGQDKSCYQYMEETTSDASLHFHLRCSRCGKLYHVRCRQLSALGLHLLSRHGFTVDFAKTTLYGICASCTDDAQN
ncbi:MAG: transcriptional repressor [Clostridia bacterium]|nr:transcriptional repressor [Clostridia bacterium]